MAASREQAIANLGDHAIEADPTRRWRLLELMKDEAVTTVGEALKKLGAGWGDVSHWRKDASWFAEYTSVLATLADRQADYATEVLREGLTHVESTPDAKRASAVASLYRDMSSRAMWRAERQDPKRWGEKVQDNQGQGVSFVVLLPPLKRTEVTATTSQPALPSADSAQVVEAEVLSIDDST